MSRDAERNAAAKLRRRLVTPEGVELGLDLGGAGERAAAFLIDVAIMVAALAALTALALSLAVGLKGVGTAGIIWLFGFFLLRNSYFAAFELGGRGATPGKRALGLRVVSARGGRLGADAVLVRNLMRELEVFLPLTLLVATGGLGTPLGLAGCLWTGIFALFPLFNRNRMRVGDLLAGTWVVHVGRRRLLPDLADGARPRPDLAFTADQAAAYGVRELQVLEQVLRKGDVDAVAAVAARIRSKIGWRGEAGDAAFLEAYYGALRARLERRLLFGHRRRDKFDAA